MLSVLEACHSLHVGGHHTGIRTTNKILKCAYYWQKNHQDAHEFAKECDNAKEIVAFRERKSSLYIPFL